MKLMIFSLIRNKEIKQEEERNASSNHGYRTGYGYGYVYMSPCNSHDFIMSCMILANPHKLSIGFNKIKTVHSNEKLQSHYNHTLKLSLKKFLNLIFPIIKVEYFV